MALTALVGTLLRASELGKMILPQRSAATVMLGYSHQTFHGALLK
jgi:hypothetical protein